MVKMGLDEIQVEVKKVIVEQLSVDEAKVVPEASFIEDLGADSLDNVELVMELEDRFGTDIPEEDAKNIKTVQNAIDYIAKKLQ